MSKDLHSFTYADDIAMLTGSENAEIGGIRIFCFNSHILT